MRRFVLLAFLVAGCGGEPDGLTIYLPQQLGPEGPHGQRVPVLMPVERERRETMSSARQAVLELMIGPAPDERAHGFEETIPLSMRLLGVRVERGVATVKLAGKEPDYLGSAAIVYSVTEVPGVRAVRLLLDGEPCCFYTHQGSAVLWAHTRRAFRGWTGEPCSLRTYAHAVRCRGDF
jgi:hypothetical protein